MTITRSAVHADIRGLTLLNPWAHAITHRMKRIENRSWPAPSSLDFILVHAGKGWDNGYDREPFLAEHVPTSAIVAVAEIAYCCNGSVMNAGRLTCGCDPEWVMPGQYHWQLGDVLVLPEPVSCRGALGLWRPKPAVLEAVKEQI